jgi:ABC-type multidrug transport system fused ATPase/permease subunit
MFFSDGTEMLVITGSVGAFVLAATLCQMHAISLGTVYLVMAYTQLLTQPLQLLMEQIADFQQASASLNRIQELLALTPESAEGMADDLPSGALAVAFEDVSFAYHPEKLVLQHIQLEMQSGEVLGVLGHTGSGKTTLSRLLFRLYDPTSGTIRLGGHNIQQMKLAHLRKRIGIVTQEVQLFHASVRNNLTFFDTDMPDRRILQALHEVGLSSWYENLPRGLDTLIAATTSAEAGLSAGEAQLLAFARVFLQDPSLVILDEASSRLDPQTERAIETAVDRLLSGRTAIVIAHRLATIQRANTIAMLDRGQLVEYGPRQALLQNPLSRLSHLMQVGLDTPQLAHLLAPGLLDEK